MITRLILIAIAICSATGLGASELTDSANRAYEAEKYSEAAELYQKAVDTEGVSSALFYNLGNARYRNGQTAEAIIAYERALRLNPANADARENLEFVNDRIVDKKGETGTFIYNTVIDIANLFSSNTWAWIAFALLALTSACALVYFFSSTIIIKKIGFFGGIVTLLICVAVLLFAFKAKSIASDNTEAIITSETATLSTVPRTPASRQEEAMLLHEGTKVKILRSIKSEADSVATTWHEVAVDNRHRAWINANDIEKIIP